MSIIHEALKKAQDSMKHLPPPAPAASVMPQTELRGQVPNLKQLGTRPSNSSMAKPAPVAPMKYLVFALIVIAGMFVLQRAAAMFAKLHTAKIQAMTAQSVPVPAPAPQVPSVAAQALFPVTPVVTDETAAVPEPESYSPKSYGSQLVLNGVTVTNGQKLALINNDIYKIGDEVMGRTIVNINLDGVELMDGDQKIILKTR